MEITFWGVRGSIATSGAEFARYGGNTTCVEVRAGDRRIVIDAGTGLRPLGQRLLRESGETGRPVDVTMLFTHLHWDHIQGFPFFAPGFLPSTHLSLHGPDDEGTSLEHALARQMERPSFPVPLGAMAARKEFHRIASGDVLQLGDVTVRTRALQHPQGSLGYRIEHGGAAFCFATDTEHLPDGTVDEALLDLADGADLLVLDAQYTPDEYEGRAGPSRRGWGHGTYVAATEAAKACGVGRLALFHHDPAHDDAFVSKMESAARGLFPATFAAREAQTIDCSAR